MQVDVGGVFKSYLLRKRMRQSVGERRRLAGLLQCSVRIAQEPVYLSLGIESAGAWIVPAIDETVRPVPLLVIKAVPFVCVSFRVSQITAKEPGGPGAVVGLQVVLVILRPVGQV